MKPDFFYLKTQDETISSDLNSMNEELPPTIEKGHAHDKPHRHKCKGTCKNCACRKSS